MDIPVGIRGELFKACLDQMKEQAHGFAESVGTLFAGIGLGAMFEGALEKAKGIEETSKKFGDTAENVQKLGNAVKLMGLDMDTVAKGGFKAFIEAQKALSGDKAAEKHFDALGISMEKLGTLTGPRDTILALADAVHGAADQHAALAAAGDLVGMRQAALIQLFRGGSQELNRLGDSFAVMSNESVHSLAEAQISIEKTKDYLTVGLGTALGWVINIVRTLGAVMGFVWAESVDGIVDVATALDALVHGNLSAARAAMQKWMSDSVADAQAMSEEIQDAWRDAAEKPLAPAGGAVDGPGKAAAAAADKQRQDQETADHRTRLMHEIDELERKHRLDSMDGEKRVQALIIQRNRIAAEPEQAKTNALADIDAEIEKQNRLKDSISAAGEQSLGLLEEEMRKRRAAEVDSIEAIHARQPLMQKIIDLEEKNGKAKLEAEQKLQDLMARRQAVVQTGADPNNPTDAQLYAQKKTLEYDEEIRRQQKENAETKARSKKEAQEKRAEYARQLAEARDGEERREEEHRLKQMSPEQQRAYLTKQRDQLYYEADQDERRSDPLAGARAREKAAGIQDKLDSIKDDAADPEKHAGHIAFKVSSLVAVGGGRAGGLAADPSLRQLERQTSALEEIRTAVHQLAGHSRTPEPRHPK